MLNNVKDSEPIIILGFGRSGTTWVSDIVSKCLSTIILFEPLHPQVYNLSKEACYNNGTIDRMNDSIKQQIISSCDGLIKDKWLLRNHISTRLEDVSTTFVKNIWNECSISGIKEIRANLMIPYLFHNLSKKIVFIKREPLSVLASLLKRTRFWEEYGFEYHTSKFLNEISNTQRFGCFLNIEHLLGVFNELTEDYLKMMFIWTVTHMIAEKETSDLGLPIFHYEDFYSNPYRETRKLCNYLGYPDAGIHPSYIFTPSMLTLKTHHEFGKGEIFDKNLNADVFYRNIIPKDQELKVRRLIDSILSK